MSDNFITDVSPLLGQKLIDDGEIDEGYEEVGDGFRGGPNPNAFEDDYRLTLNGDQVTKAVYTFNELPDGTYDVYVTWPSHDSRSREVVYSLGNAVTPISVLAATDDTTDPSPSVDDPTADQTLTIDPVAGTLDLNGQGFGEIVEFNGVLIEWHGHNGNDGIAEFLVHGDLIVNETDTITAVLRETDQAQPGIRLIIANDAIVNGDIDVSAEGGGHRAGGGLGSDGGVGGLRGIGGLNGGIGGSGNKSPGGPGGRGTGGDERHPGNSADPGTAGGDGHSENQGGIGTAGDDGKAGTPGQRK